MAMPKESPTDNQHFTKKLFLKVFGIEQVGVWKWDK
jgi:hypothetical protein